MRWLIGCSMQTPEAGAHGWMRAVEDNDRIEDEIDRRTEVIWNTEDIIGQALVLLTNEGVCDHLLDDVVRQLATNRVEMDLEERAGNP